MGHKDDVLMDKNVKLIYRNVSENVAMRNVRKIDNVTKRKEAKL